ncbi:MAG: OprO/OprP family phosphate-selective porin, partial [Ectothiorhodospiraceae bacterium]|nr:OprO/OprP family phosphate-selective porin [Ectothiorhodospiraceae bacterium]
MQKNALQTLNALALAGVIGATGWVGTAAADEDGITVGGAVRFNYDYNDADAESRDSLGDFNLDVVRFNMRGRMGAWSLDAEYRFYDGFRTPRQLAIGYDFNDQWSTEFGAVEQYFGIMPLGAYGFQLSTLYEVGLEDAIKQGANVHYNSNGTHLTLALYKNGELGRAGSNQRYSPDVAVFGDPDDDDFFEQNYERNTLALRLAQQLSFGNGLGLEVGLSGMYGELRNQVEDETGSRWAAAAHGIFTAGNLDLRAQAGAYEFDPEESVDRDTINVRAFGADWEIPQEANFYLVGAAYTLHTSGLLDYVQFYNHYSLLTDEAGDLDDYQKNVAGAL